MQYLYLSYPQGEYELAHRLVDDLQAAGYMVFVDAVSEPGGMAWAAETRHAIRACGALILILDPEEGRKVGMRHEGILAKRRDKPVFVLRRSAGDLPRYLAHATEIDFTGAYETAFPALRAALPDPLVLLQSSEPVPRRRPRRPPRPRDYRLRRRRQLQWGVALIVVAILAGIALGVIPV